MKYKHWDIYDEMPEGYKVSKYCDSPLHGYVFINNGSILKNEKYALLKIKKNIMPINNLKPTLLINHTNPTTPYVFPAFEMQKLARLKTIEHLLNDILIDLNICKLEGWGHTEYVNELKNIINSIKIK